MKKPLIIIFIVLLLDQILKFWIKLNMTIGESFPVLGNWFQIYFIENNGMAFGWELGAQWGKLALSVFRIIAVALLFYLIYYLSKKKVKFGPLFGISLITAGAMGNIIDGMFYGMIFSESTFYQLASLFPEGGGYSGLSRYRFHFQRGLSEEDHTAEPAYVRRAAVQGRRCFGILQGEQQPGRASGVYRSLPVL